MELTKWSCESCGSPLPIPGSGFVTCESCGMVYHVDGYESPRYKGAYEGIYYNEGNVLIGYEAGQYASAGDYTVIIGTTGIAYE